MLSPDEITEAVHAYFADHACSPEFKLIATTFRGQTPPEVDYSPVRAPALELLFKEQQRFLNYFFDNLEYGPLEELCQARAASSLRKSAKTLVSTGTKALFLNPTDALHGDLGIVSASDLLIMLSKSGCTEELIRLVPFAKAKGAKLVCVSCVAGSRLSEVCDLSIQLPLERELCPFDLAPVTSTAIQMLFGDHRLDRPHAGAQSDAGSIRNESPSGADRPQADAAGG
eukprot:jgi/Botrbrau1/11507/Bobra.0198s0005.1